jgi:hypothetical protein
VKRKAVAAFLSLLIAGLAATFALAAPRALPGEGFGLIAVRESMLGAHRWYEQTYLGLPVLGGFFGRHGCGVLPPIG